MHLVVDVGNTNIKCFIFNNDELLFDARYECEVFLSSSLELPLLQNISSGIICNVSKYQTESITQKFPTVAWTKFTRDTKIPLGNAYETPESLGLDRLAAAVGAEFLFPKMNKLIIDMGTAITIDFVDEASTYQGGNISLGMSSRFRALHDYTGKLPLVKQTDDVSLIGKNTNDAILNGVIQGISYELDGYIETYRSHYQNVMILFTGGDALFFENKLKNSIFVHRNLVALGLLSVLKFNEK